MKKDTSKTSDEEVETTDTPTDHGGQVKDPAFNMPEWKTSWLQDDEPEDYLGPPMSADASIELQTPTWAGHSPLPGAPLMLCSPLVEESGQPWSEPQTGQTPIAPFAPRLQVPCLMEESAEITWDAIGEDDVRIESGVSPNPFSEGTASFPRAGLRLKDTGHPLQLSPEAPDESLKAGYLAHDSAIRRFSPRSDADVYGRALLDLIDFPGVATSEDLLPLESGPLLPNEEEESHLEQIAEERSLPGLAEEVWATLRRAAALGLQPGENLVDTPRICEFNPLVTQFQVLQSKDAQDPPEATELPDMITGDLTPLPSEWPEDNSPEAESGSLLPLEPKSTLLEIPDSMRTHIAQPELIDMRGLLEGPKMRSWNPDQSVMTFPQPATDEDIETHPFFTTMEIKNQAFSRTGSMDSDLEKVSKEIESEAWSRGSDDKVVGGRFSRRRRTKKSK